MKPIKYQTIASCGFIALCLLLCLPAFTQEKRNPSIGVNAQVYPTGEIPGIGLELPIKSSLSLEFRLGYNVVRHEDYGVHEDEKGGGFGGSIGFRQYLREPENGFFLGPRLDVWANEIDWKDQIGSPLKESGTTKLIVLQPSIMGGYKIPLGAGDYTIAPTIALGMEVNIHSEGEETGQGPIFLLGFEFYKTIMD